MLIRLSPFYNYIRARVVRAAQKLHLHGVYHGALLTGNRMTGFRLSNNIRLTNDGEVVFVNFEKASKHKGFSCPSAESGGELRQRGCQELDDLYEFYRPWRVQADPDVPVSDDVDWDTYSDSD